MIPFDNTGWLALALLTVLSLTAAALVVVRARRAGLNLHRQIDQARAEAAAAFAELRDLAAVAERLEAERSRQLEAMLAERMDAQWEAVRDAMRGGVPQFMWRQPAYAAPAAAAGLESLSDGELLKLAGSLATLRPLVPYPRWKYDADFYNPDLAFQLRRWIWMHFHQRRAIAPVVVPWHGGTRLRLFLGNDVSGQIYIAGCIEPNEFVLLDRILRPGMVFVDAGANEGIYTVFASAKVGAGGRVLAFEPSRREVERLKFNLELNGAANAQVFPVALADREGTAELKLGSEAHPGHNTLGDFIHEIEPAGAEEVAVRRLDDMIREQTPGRVDVIKMDVEGAESKLVRGAIRTLREFRPVILFEANDASLARQGSGREELLGRLRALDYTIHIFDRATGLPVPARAGEYGENMIAVPAESPLPPEAGRVLPEPAPK